MTYSIPKWRAYMSYDPDEASNSAAIPPDGHGDSLTVQSMAEDADINVMLKRMGLGEKIPENVRVPTYGDFTGINDYRAALEALFGAQTEFMKLPASIRNRFENDPEKFVDFCFDQNNKDELVKMGLTKVVEPAIVQPVPPGVKEPQPAVPPGK